MTKLEDLGEGRLQARCHRCMRQSPVLALSSEPALATLTNLGWKDEGATLVCPICTTRQSVRVRDR